MISITKGKRIKIEQCMLKTQKRVKCKITSTQRFPLEMQSLPLFYDQEFQRGWRFSVIMLQMWIISLFLLQIRKELTVLPTDHITERHIRTNLFQKVTPSFQKATFGLLQKPEMAFLRLLQAILKPAEAK